MVKSKTDKGPVATPPYDGIKEYFYVLGTFVHQFAQIESSLLSVLWVQTGVDPQTALAIFSGVRINTAQDFIKRTRDAKKLPRHEALERAVTQLTVITKAQNDILHYGAMYDGGAWTVSNVRAAHTDLSRRSFSASPENLWAMIADLNRIGATLSAYQFELALNTPGIVFGGDPPQPVMEMLQQVGSAPWQYKPALQSHKNRPPRAPNPKRRRPPKP